MLFYKSFYDESRKKKIKKIKSLNNYSFKQNKNEFIY